MNKTERLAALEVKVNWTLAILVAHVGIEGAQMGLNSMGAVLTWLGL